MADELYYRFEDYLESTGGYDIMGEWEPGPSRTKIRLRSYRVIKHTPKGAWIRADGEKRFICSNWTKRFALPSIEEAKHSFIKRKERQASIYEARARIAKEAILLAKGDRFQDLTKGFFTP